MFTSNNLSIIDETGRSDVMAAAIPAANKWLLTKQASVALSGLWDDRHGEAWRRCRKQGAEGKCWKLRLLGTWGGHQRGRRSRMILWCKVGDTPMRGCQKSVNRRGRWEWKKKEGRDAEGVCGGARGTGWWEQLHAVCWVQWASCPLPFHL